MGKIKRQSIISTLFLYVGISIGFFNMIILLPMALGQAGFGFYSFFMTIGTTIALIIQLGLPNTIIRYFPYFNNKETKHDGFFGFISMAPIIGTIITLPFLIYFKEGFVELIGSSGLGSKDKDLIHQYYWLFLIFSFFVAYYNIFNSYAQSLLKSVLPIFLRQVVVKLAIAGLCGLLIFKVIDLELFFYLLTFCFLVQALILLLSFVLKGETGWKVNWKKFTPELRKDMAKFTGFSWLARSVPYLVDNIDTILITALAAGHFTDTGIYTPFAFGGKALATPAGAVNAITIPLIARAWKDNNLAEIANLYRKTSINLLVIGGLLFVGIIANLENLVLLLGAITGDDYSAGKYVAFYIGLAYLFDMATGVNGGIITNSRYYYFNLILIVLLLIGTVISDLICIPLYGLLGAAIATAAARFLFNFGKMVFVWWKFKMQPFSVKTLWTVLLIALLSFASYYTPPLENFVLDLIVRSAVIASLYIGLALALNLSPDLTNTFFGLLRRLGLKKD